MSEHTETHAPPGWRGLLDWRTGLVGFVAGLLNGLIGLGGGIVIVPGLIMLRGMRPRVAVSTSLAAVFMMALFAMLVHVALSGFILGLGGAGLTLAAGVVGAQVGGRLLNVIPQRSVLFLFATLSICSGLYLVAQALGVASPVTQSGNAPPAWGYLLVGGVSGTLSGLLGIGGGGLVILGFSILFDAPVLGGIPIALAVNVTNSLSGVAVQWRTGQTRWSEALRLVPAALVGAAVGAVLAVALPERALRIIFALFFMFMGLRMMRKGLGER